MIYFLPLAILIALPTMFGGMDMAVAEKWGKAKVVKYRVEGVHKARTNVVFGDYEGKGDVTDRLTLEFTWDVKKRKVLGQVTVVDGKTEVSNLKSDGTNCGPPQLKGEYEHFQSVSNSAAGEQMEIKGTRTYPAARSPTTPRAAPCAASPAARSRSPCISWRWPPRPSACRSVRARRLPLRRTGRASR